MKPNDFCLVWYGVLNETYIHGIYRPLDTTYKFHKDYISFWGKVGKPLTFKCIKTFKTNYAYNKSREKKRIGYVSKDVIPTHIEEEFSQFLTFKKLVENI